MNIEAVREDALSLLTDNILPFWSDKMVDIVNGGFYGRMDGNGNICAESDKGAILNARILWSFSAAYRVVGNFCYLETATRQLTYFIDHFYDPAFGGIYWSVDYLGRPKNTKKQFYAIGFAIYGLTEYVRAVRERQPSNGNYNTYAALALNHAIELFKTIERYSYDATYGGYTEACARDWQEIDDVRLSNKDSNEKKTMNTHLHIIEPYANLYEVWPHKEVGDAIQRLLRLFIDKIIDKKSSHLGLFFDERWVRHGNEISYGHDIESSWLLVEAARRLGDAALIEDVKDVAVHIASAAYEGIQPDGSMIYEIRSDGTVDRERHWWVQAELVVGAYYQADYDKLSMAYDYIKSNLVIPTGEWYWSVKSDGKANTVDDRAGFWKCPYHNTRMCLELQNEIESVTA